LDNTILAELVLCGEAKSLKINNLHMKAFHGTSAAWKVNLNFFLSFKKILKRY
jgi:hypothetical protein